MSNRSLIESLEHELDQYKADQFSGDGIGIRFNNHIEALEGIPYSVVLQARDFAYELQGDWFNVEAGCRSNSEEICAKIKVWLNDLRDRYCC